jgi:hypothetical protein
VDETSRIDQRSYRRGAIVLATALYVLVAVGWVSNRVSATVRPSQIIVTVPGCVVNPADILGWWRGDDVTAGIGADLNGTIPSAPGVIGQALAFDGASLASIEAFPTVSAALTLEAWIKPVATGSVQAIFSKWDFPSTDDSARSYFLYLDASSNLVFETDELTSQRPEVLRAATPQLGNGFFHHVAATWDASAITLYVDGEVAATAPSQRGSLNAASTTPFQLGAQGNSGSQFRFMGLIDEPSVIGRALTATQVRGLVDAGPKGKCLPPPG